MDAVVNTPQPLSLIASSKPRKTGVWSRQDPESKKWHQYSHLENELIEDAYRRKLLLFELPDDHVLSFDDMVAGYKSAKLKREELRDVESRYLLDERFTSPIKTSTKLLSEEQKAGSELAVDWFFWYGQHLEDFHREAVEGAAKGIFTESLLLGEEKDGRLIENELNKVKDAEDENEIFDCCARLYTTTSFLYKLVNATLRNEDFTKMETLGSYVWLLQEYLRKNRINNKELTVYRGTILTDEIIEEYKSATGSEEWISWLGFTSTSKNREVAKMFCGNTLFIIKTQSTKLMNELSDLSTISVIPDEEEVLLMAGHPFYVDSVEYDVGSGKHFVYLSWSGMYRHNLN